MRWDPELGALILRGSQGGPMPSHEFPLSGWPRGMAAHIRFSGVAREIVPGPEEWQDGRVVVIWRNEENQVLQHHYGLLGAENTGRFELEYVAVLDQPGQASIFLQHAGYSGEFEIDGMDITPVGLRVWVPGATAALLGATAIWWALLFRGIAGRGGFWRPLGASALGLAAVWTLVLPGPWEPLRPLGGSFVFQQSAKPLPPAEVVEMPKPAPVEPDVKAPAPTWPLTPSTVTQSNPPAAAPRTAHPPAEPPKASSGIPVPGALDSGWFWEAYRWVKSRARSLMHLAVFAALTLAFVTLLQSARGWIPVAILCFASEMMQTLFGFGFGWEDAVDLAVNGLGIAAGLLASSRWKSWRAKPADS